MNKKKKWKNCFRVFKYNLIKVTLYTLLLLSSFYTCTQNESSSYKKNYEPVYVNGDNIHKAYFASGCFWCVEAIYESLLGVNEVTSGYSGGCRNH